MEGSQGQGAGSWVCAEGQPSSLAEALCCGHGERRFLAAPLPQMEPFPARSLPLTRALLLSIGAG